MAHRRHGCVSLNGASLKAIGGVLVAALALTATPALAAGSLPLTDVLAAVKGSPKLVAEIDTALADNALVVTAVICSGARHGRHWVYLGGARAAPYTCRIGKRDITIEADRIYFDAKGRKLGDLDHASPKQAKTFRESNFRWTWSK